MLNIFYSNKLEVLSAQLCAQIAQQPLPALKPETIVVESSAMAQWLTKEMTSQLGIAANLKFPFPAALVWQVYRQCLSGLAKESSFDRPVLIWRLYELFISNDFEGMPELQHYIANLTNNKQKLHFAEYVADLYDQYQIYRPDWLANWEKGSQGKEREGINNNWQAKLWQILCKERPGDINRAQVFLQVLALLPDIEKQQIEKLSSRLNIFAVATLPQTYIELFAALAEKIEVNVYVLNPCAGFWQNLQSKKVQVRQVQLTQTQSDLFAADDSEQNCLQEQSHVEESVQNELLALMAKQGRDYISLLQEQEQIEEFDCFVKVKQSTLLGHLQNDILTLRQARLGEEKENITSDDHSIQFHSCHSPLREVQVLHNQLLKLLDDNNDISLDDIVVMVPELETYAPYFHAVFATADSGIHLSYHLAERKSFDDQPVKRSLVQLLKVSSQQYLRAEIASLLQESTVANKFGITDIELINQLLEELQVRFHLKDEGWLKMGEQVVSFSWQQAKERLLLSFAAAEFAPEVDSLNVEGIYDSAAEQTGRLCEFIDQLSFLEYQNRNRTLISWCEYIEQVLQRFFKLEEESQLSEAKTIRAVLEKIQQTSELAAYASEIEFDLFIHVFESCLQQESQSHFFKQGAINIATLLPMRSLPFKIVCMLGMNDGEFPRPASNDRIDLMVDRPRKGDRSRREEDRYLFLEALLAARHTSYISYIGRSNIDNTERYPSLLVTELIEHLNDCYQVKDTELKKQLITQHKLQAFDAAYFNSEMQFFSYNTHQLKQSERILQEKISPVFSIKPLEEFKEPEVAKQVVTEQVDIKQVQLQDLLNAIVEPSRFYLQQLQVKVELDDITDENIESFQVDHLDKYLLLDMLFKLLVNKEPLPNAEHLIRRGLLPQAVAGEIDYSEVKQSVCDLYDQVESHRLDIGDNRTALTVSLGKYELSGEISSCNTENTQRIAVLCNKLHGKHVLKAWVSHLFACCGFEKSLKSYILTPEKCYKLNSVSPVDAQTILLDLLEIYAANQYGLSWFFPKSAWAYINGLQKDESKAEKELSLNLYGSERSFGEWNSLQNSYAYRGKDVDESAIVDLARRVINPIMDYFVEMSLDKIEEEAD